MKQKFLVRCMLLLLLCCPLLASAAHADFVPKPEVNVTVINAPAETIYMDVLIETEPEPDGGYGLTQAELAQYSPVILEQLHTLEDDGWTLALASGTSYVLFGSLTPRADGTWRFSYRPPERFRLAVATADFAQATRPYTRAYISNLVYDWQSNTLRAATPTPVRFLARLLATLIPTLLVEGALLLVFGFRQKRTWLVFLMVNVVTQVALHIFVGSQSAIAGDSLFSYLALFLLPELFIWAVETVAYQALIEERSSGKRAGYAFLANWASFLFGFLPLHFLFPFLTSL